MDNTPNYNNPFVYIGLGAGIVFVLAVCLALLPVWLGATILFTCVGGFIGFMLWAGINGHLDGY